MPRRVVPIFTVPGAAASSRSPSSSRWNGRMSVALSAICKVSGVTATPCPAIFSTSARKAQGSSTTPLPSTESLPGRTEPDGSSDSL